MNKFDDLALAALAAALDVAPSQIVDVSWFGQCGCYSEYTYEHNVGVTVTLSDGKTKAIEWGLPAALRQMADYEEASQQANDECPYFYKDTDE